MSEYYAGIHVKFDPVEIVEDTVDKITRFLSVMKTLKTIVIGGDFSAYLDRRQRRRTTTLINPIA